MSVDANEVEIQRQWQAFLLDQNRRGARLILFIVLGLYPTFGILDYLIAPREWLWLLWASRIAVTVCTFAMFPLLRSKLFERKPEVVTSVYMLLCAVGIAVMLAVMGGLVSPD